MLAVQPLPEWSGIEHQVVPHRKVWHWLGLFESADYARRAIREHATRKGMRREPSAHETRDLVACLKQGRGYFEAAAAADTNVSPLLLYYGVLALAKAIIIARGSRRGLHTMAHSHGLKASAIAMQNVGSAALTTDICAYSAAIEPAGTFIEFAEALNLPLSLHVFDEATSRTTTLTIPQVSLPVLPGQTVTLGGLLSRQPALGSLYHHAIGATAESFLATLSVDYRSAVTYTVRLAHDASRPDLRACAERSFPQLRGVEWHDEAGGSLHMPFSGGCASARVCEALPMFPASATMGLTRQVGGAAGYLITPFPFGVLSETLQLYLLSFLLGMLVRYTPTIWMQVLAGGTGDAAMPVLRGAVDLVRERFPSLALAGLTSYEHELSFSTY